MKWETVKLGEICEVSAGGTPSRAKLEYYGGNIPWVKISDMLQSLVMHTDESITEQAIAASSAKIFPRGTILISIFATVGRTAVLGIDAATNQAIAGLKIKDEKRISPFYLRRFLDKSTKDLIALSRGVAQVNINLSILKDFAIPLPPLAEQQRIASVLDAADQLRARRRESLSRLDALTHALFLEMFGDPAHNPKEWPRVKLGEVGKVSTGGTPPSSLEGMFDGKIAFVTPGDLDNNAAIKRTVTEAGAAKSRTVRAGSTMVCCIGTIGKMKKISVRSAFNQQINAVEWSDSVDDDYGFQALQFTKETMKLLSPSTTLPILKKSLFETIEIPLPPLPLQLQFAERLAQIEVFRARMDTSRLELDALFASLQSAAFE